MASKTAGILLFEGNGRGDLQLFIRFFDEFAVIFRNFLKFQTVFARFICDEIFRFGKFIEPFKFTKSLKFIN